MLSSLVRVCGIVALVSRFDTAFAQIAPQFTCNVNAANPTISRADGVTELVGDYVLQCSGGTPTPAGQPIPAVDVQLTLITTITNRLVQGSVTDALLMIDEPYAPLDQRVPNNAFPPPAGAGPQNLCAPSGVLGGSCTLIGTGGNPIPYSTQPNIFAGTLVASNAIRWSGVPLDPPGAGAVLVLRFTNIRANAAQLGVSSTLIPTQIVAFVGASGGIPVINNPQQTLAFLQPGTVFSTTYPETLQQCTPHNASLLGSSGTPAFDFNVTITEAFANSLKRRNIGLTTDGSTAPQVYAQNVPGFAYNDETGFYAPALFTPYPNVGLADHGSRIRIQFNNVGLGTHLFVPTSITLRTSFGQSNPVEPPPPVPAGITTPQMRLIQADINGNSPDPAYVSVAGTATIGSTPVAEANYDGTTAFVTYEVVNVDPNAVERAIIPVAVAFATSPPAGPVTFNVSLAPLSSVAVADASAPIPRFVGSFPRYVFSIGTCPVITWPKPASISFGTALGNRQLNATANVQGDFVYAASSGTVLPVGNGQTLSASFTPWDSSNYSPASATTTIDVLPGTAAGVQIIATNVMKRDANNNIMLALTLANAGLSAANNVTLTAVRVGTTAGSPLPKVLGTIAANSLVQAVLTVPGSAAASLTLTSLTVSGTYTGGTFNVTSRIVAP